MKKRSMHRIHLEDGVWKWYVKGQRRPIVIFAASGKRYELKITDYLMFLGWGAEEENLNRRRWGVEQMMDDMAYVITPSNIKRYILEKLKGVDQSWQLCRA